MNRFAELALKEIEQAATYKRPRDWGFTEYNLKRALVYAVLAVAESVEEGNGK